MPIWNPSMVFSGPMPDPPRWAKLIGQSVGVADARGSGPTSRWRQALRAAAPPTPIASPATRGRADRDLVVVGARDFRSSGARSTTLSAAAPPAPIASPATSGRADRDLVVVGRSEERRVGKGWI